MKSLLPLLLIAAAAAAMADEVTVCTLNGSERIITLITRAAGCEVRYTKDGETKTLWSSSHSGYCPSRAANFIEQQRNWGFQCREQPAASTADAAATTPKP